MICNTNAIAFNDCGDAYINTRTHIYIYIAVSLKEY